MFLLVIFMLQSRSYSCFLSSFLMLSRSKVLLHLKNISSQMWRGKKVEKKQFFYCILVSQLFSTNMYGQLSMRLTGVFLPESSSDPVICPRLPCPLPPCDRSEWIPWYYDYHGKNCTGCYQCPALEESLRVSDLEVRHVVFGDFSISVWIVNILIVCCDRGDLCLKMGVCGLRNWEIEK